METKRRGRMVALPKKRRRKRKKKKWKKRVHHRLKFMCCAWEKKT
jgi:hypothetical protein